MEEGLDRSLGCRGTLRGMAGPLDSTQALLDFTIQVRESLHCFRLACVIITTQDSALQDESEDEVFFGAVHSVEKNGRSKIRWQFCGKESIEMPSE